MKYILFSILFVGFFLSLYAHSIPPEEHLNFNYSRPASSCPPSAPPLIGSFNFTVINGIVHANIDKCDYVLPVNHPVPETSCSGSGYDISCTFEDTWYPTGNAGTGFLNDSHQTGAGNEHITPQSDVDKINEQTSRYCSHAKCDSDGEPVDIDDFLEFVKNDSGSGSGSGSGAGTGGGASTAGAGTGGGYVSGGSGVTGGGSAVGSGSGDSYGKGDDDGILAELHAFHHDSDKYDSQLLERLNTDKLDDVANGLTGRLSGSLKGLLSGQHVGGDFEEASHLMGQIGNGSDSPLLGKFLDGKLIPIIDTRRCDMPVFGRGTEWEFTLNSVYLYKLKQILTFIMYALTFWYLFDMLTNVGGRD